MKYKVLNMFPINNNTSITIEGNGDGLKNGMGIKTSEGIEYTILSVAMVRTLSDESTIILVDGRFDSAEIIF